MPYKYRLLGTGTTNSEGLATLSKDPNNTSITGYTGAGAGRLQIIVSDKSSPTTTGAINSPVKEILDCTKYDHATSTDYNNTIWSSGAANITRTDNDSYITSTNAVNRSIGITDNICIEIDIKTDITDNSHAIFAINDYSTFRATLSNIGHIVDTYQHYKITIIDGEVTVTNTTNPVTPYTGTVTTPTSFLLRVPATNTVWFHDVEIYPI